MTEGIIGKWLVEPGQRVEKYDPLVEVFTDKVSMEAPSPHSGVFTRALVEEGQTVPMGEPICEMEVDGVADAAPEAVAEEPAAASPPEGVAEEPAAESAPELESVAEEPAAASAPEPESVADEPAVAESATDAADSAQEAGVGESASEPTVADADGEEETDEDADEPAAESATDAADSAQEVRVEESASEPAVADADGEEETDEGADEAVAEDAAQEGEDADAADDGEGRVGGAWAMPAAQDAGAESVADGESAGEDSAEPEGDDAAERREGAPSASEHPFEFVGSVRSVGPTGSGERGEGRPDAAQDAGGAPQEESSAPRAAAEPDRRHVVSPLVARLSAQYGIDLSTVRGTGTGGRVTSQDLLNAVSAAEERRAAESAQAAQEDAAADETSETASAEPQEEREHPAPVAEQADEREEAVAPTVAEQGAASAESQEGRERPAPVAEQADEREEAAAPAPPIAERGAASVESPEERERPAPVAERAEEREETVASAAPVAEQGAASAATREEREQPAPVAERAEEREEAIAPSAPVAEQGAASAATREEREHPAPVAERTEEREEAAAPAPVAEQAAASAESQEDDGVSTLPVTPIRRAIAEHMARSASEIPAAWAMVEADASGMVRAREAHRGAFERERGIPLTYLPFLASAAARALRGHPRLNARWDDGRIVVNNRVNLSVAVSTEAGLMVPVLRDADRLSVAELAVALRRLADAARGGRLTLDDVQGGTFTLNNTGALGSVVSVPIINHPQAAILTTEAIVKRPVVVGEDAIAARSMMNLCVSFDHRVCDGADAAAFLRSVKARLEEMDESAALEQQAWAIC